MEDSSRYQIEKQATSEKLKKLGWCLLRGLAWLLGFTAVTLIVLAFMFYVPGSGVYVTIGVIVLVIIICICAYKRPVPPCWKKKQVPDNEQQGQEVIGEAAANAPNVGNRLAAGGMNEKLPIANYSAAAGGANVMVTTASYNDNRNMLLGDNGINNTPLTTSNTSTCSSKIPDYDCNPVIVNTSHPNTMINSPVIGLVQQHPPQYSPNQQPLVTIATPPHSTTSSSPQHPAHQPAVMLHSPVNPHRHQQQAPGGHTLDYSTQNQGGVNQPLIPQHPQYYNQQQYHDQRQQYAHDQRQQYAEIDSSQDIDDCLSSLAYIAF